LKRAEPPALRLPDPPTYRFSDFPIIRTSGFTLTQKFRLGNYTPPTASTIKMQKKRKAQDAFIELQRMM